MPNLARASRFTVTIAVNLAVVLFSTGCGAAPSPAAEAPSMPAMAPAAEAAPMPPPPPAPAGGAPAQMGYAPPSAPGDTVPAAFTGDAPAAAPAAAPPSRAPAAAPASGAKGPVAVAKVAPTPPPAKAPPPPAKGTPPAKGAEPGAPPAAAQVATAPVAPLLIYVGDLQMLVPEEAAIPATIDKVIDIAESLGGYLAGRKDTSVQVRIPSARFREGFTTLEKLGDVTHRSVSADDVSEQYSDLEVKLQNLRATQKRLQEFLAKAGNVPEMLNVGRELERVAGEIEAIEGKMRFLRSRAAFSLVTVGFGVKPKTVVVVAKDEPPPPRQISLPIDWLPRVGLDTLLNLH